jgi:hypothetical protein
MIQLFFKSKRIYSEYLWLRYEPDSSPMSNKNGTGVLASIDSLVTFLPFQSFVATQQQENLTQAVQQLLQQSNLTPLQRMQYSILQQWLMGIVVPQVEIVLFSKGLINPANGSSYMAMASGIMHPLSRGTVVSVSSTGQSGSDTIPSAHRQ